MVPFKPLGDRVVIQADVESHAPQQTASGLYVAGSLASAVEGSDEAQSWFVGTVVSCGPLVNAFDVRAYVKTKLKSIYSVADIQQLIRDLDTLPTECPDPVKVGDRVLFSWASGQEARIDGDKYLLMSAREVLAILDEVVA